MQTRKRNRTFFSIYISAFVCFFACTSSVSYDSNILLTSRLENNLKYYQEIIDSSQWNSFGNYYSRTIKCISEKQDKIEVIGERALVQSDSTVIETFIISRKKNKYYLSFIRNVNGVLTQKDIENKFPLPDLPLYCDAHYFYMAKSKFLAEKYNSYSILMAGDHSRETKIFLSEKFDKFNNVICPCDESELTNIIAYVNKGFTITTFR